MSRLPPSISSRNRLAHVLAVGAQNADLARQRAIAKAVTETAQIGVSIDRWEDAEANKEVKEHPRREWILNTETCLICLGDIRESALQGDETRNIEVLVEVPEKNVCGHAFHRTCLATWLNSSSLCPVCKRDIPQHVIDRLGGSARSGQDAQLGPGSDPFYDNSQEGSNDTRQEPRVGIDFDESQQSLSALGPDAESQEEPRDNDADAPASESQPGFGEEPDPGVFD